MLAVDNCRRSCNEAIMTDQKTPTEAQARRRGVACGTHGERRAQPNSVGGGAGCGGHPRPQAEVADTARGHGARAIPAQAGSEIAPLDPAPPQPRHQNAQARASRASAGGDCCCLFFRWCLFFFRSRLLLFSLLF